MVTNVEPDDVTFWAVATTDDNPRFLSEQGTWATIATAIRFGAEPDARAAKRPDKRPYRVTRISPHLV